jgi:hypothetical protein
MFSFSLPRESSHRGAGKLLKMTIGKGLKLVLLGCRLWSGWSFCANETDEEFAVWNWR